MGADISGYGIFAYSYQADAGFVIAISIQRSLGRGSYIDSVAGCGTGGNNCSTAANVGSYRSGIYPGFGRYDGSVDSADAGIGLFGNGCSRAAGLGDYVHAAAGDISAAGNIGIDCISGEFGQYVDHSDADQCHTGVGNLRAGSYRTRQFRSYRNISISVDGNLPVNVGIDLGS